MKMITTLAAGAAMAFVANPCANPAMAQGTVGPIKRLERCPTYYSPKFGANDGLCYPSTNYVKVPSVYIPKNKRECATGYRPDGPYCTDEPAPDLTPAADKLVSYGAITKANRLDRCPLGHFSKSDMTTCTTRLSPAPKSRKKTGACNSNEIDEWGLYCTADATVITREQAEQEADRDFNAIYSANGAQGPTQTPSGDDTTNSAPMVAAYGRKGGGSSSSSSSGSGDGQTAQKSGCANGSTTGAAIGGAMAGEGGAALGSMLGGLGKKKKKQGC